MPEDVRGIRNLAEDTTQPAPGKAVLARPGGLHLLAVDHDLLGLVPQLAEEVRVGVRRSEERPHQRSPLNIVRLLLQSLRGGIVRRQEGGVAGISDQDPHSASTSDRTGPHKSHQRAAAVDPGDLGPAVAGDEVSEGLLTPEVDMPFKRILLAIRDSDHDASVLGAEFGEKEKSFVRPVKMLEHLRADDEIEPPRWEIDLEQVAADSTGGGYKLCEACEARLGVIDAYHLVDSRKP